MGATPSYIDKDFKMSEKCEKESDKSWPGMCSWWHVSRLDTRLHLGLSSICLLLNLNTKTDRICILLQSLMLQNLIDVYDLGFPGCSINLLQSCCCWKLFVVYSLVVKSVIATPFQPWSLCAPRVNPCALDSSSDPLDPWVVSSLCLFFLALFDLTKLHSPDSSMVCAVLLSPLTSQVGSLFA